MVEVQSQPVAAWEFSAGTRGWSAMMGVKELRAEAGELRFVTTSGDPAVSAKLGGVPARRYPYIIIKMRVDAREGEAADPAQLFWSTTTTPVHEPASLKFTPANDGEFHTYTLNAAENKRWRGRLATFRFDPCSRPGAKVAIAEVRLSADGK